jgi:hypothetical protein
MFIAPLIEVQFHADLEGNIMCYRCCRDVHWFSSGRCNMCSDRTMCKGKFLPNMKRALDNIKGV